MRRYVNEYLKLSNASIHRDHVRIVAEFLRAVLSSEQVHSQTGKHEEKQDKQKESLYKRSPPLYDVQDNPTHAREQADDTNRS